MGTITQTAPSGTISSLAGLSLDATYTRSVPTDALGVLELAEIHVYAHGGGDHSGDVELWHFLGNIPSAGVEADECSIPLPELGIQDGVSHCWDLRLRDRLGNWTAVAHQAGSIFSLDSPAPELSLAWPIQAEASDWPVQAATPPVLDNLNGLKFSAKLTDDGANSPHLVTVELIGQVAAESWDGGSYSASALLWRHEGQVFTRYEDRDRIVVRYDGRRLRPARTYLWRMRVRNSRGTYSEYVGGEFDLDDDFGGRLIPAITTFADA